MNRETVSKALGNIDSEYIQEAGNYTTKVKREHFFKKTSFKVAMAAILVLCFFVGGISILGDSFLGFFPSHVMVVHAYAHGTDEEITASGAVLHTGTIDDSGEQKGHPLMFYLSGQGIESVRFSCKNQKLYFRDWSEKRDEYGTARNFTVPYGEDESEYYYLTIEWMPDDTISQLHEGSSIEMLPEELREDLIVMEIVFANGEMAVKAVSVSLLDEGTVFAQFGDYDISDEDTFVKRADALTLRELSQIEMEAMREEEIKEAKETESTENAQNTEKPETDLAQNSGDGQGNGTESEESIDPAIWETARKYYDGTVFEVLSMRVKSVTENEIILWVSVSKGGVIQNPERQIFLQPKDGAWEVVNEGY